ncbi:MAG: hypothetical protein PHD87_01405 [Candidatus Cloacimonetes bacterium]|nr:hypothetical protein [Candidatus Cloacimonadota bacterium]
MQLKHLLLIVGVILIVLIVLVINYNESKAKQQDYEKEFKKMADMYLPPSNFNPNQETITLINFKIDELNRNISQCKRQQSTYKTFIIICGLSLLILGWGIYNAIKEFSQQD